MLGINLSVIAICKNERHNIQKFLGSVGLVADEIVIVDTGSTDATVDGFRKLGFREKGKSTLKLRHFAWKSDFAAARNFALSHATGNWILWMDLDDRLGTNAPQIINKIKMHDASNPEHRLAFGFQILSETEEPGVYTRFIQARMFPRIRGIAWNRAIHESLHKSLELKSVKLEPMPECQIIHIGYVDPIITQQKAMRNAKILESLHEETYEKFYQLGDAYFAMNAIDIGAVNYYTARGFAVTDLQRDSATERLIFGRLMMGNFEEARTELLSLKEGSPERIFWEAEMALHDKQDEIAGPLYEKLLEIEYEPQSMNSYLDAYKNRAIQVLSKMQELYLAANPEEKEIAHA